MADVGDSIRRYLLDQTAISSVISERIFPEILKQGSELPAVTYRKISGFHEHKIDGYAGIAKARFTFDCYAETRPAANSLATSIASAMNGLRGTLTGVDICAAEFDSGPETYTDSPQDGSDKHRYYTAIDFLVTYRE